MRFFWTATLLILTLSATAQRGKIMGRVYDVVNNESLPLAAIAIQGTDIGTTTDFDGNYVLEGLEPGLYNVEAQFIGYKPMVMYEIEVTNAKPRTLDFPLEPSTQELEEVVVSVQNKFIENKESPTSLQTLGINEIQRNPGGNQDISRVIQSLPGVASTVAFRNDLIIRGGGPNENRFYLDGIEIPAINHFATQGSSGGPVGMINVNFIRDVDFYTGAFPADRGNTLSSLMELNLKDGRKDKIGGIFQIGASDIGLTLEGPLSKKTTFLASARRSYLQFLFSVLDLPFLPTYNDFQFKVKYNIDNKNQLTLIGLGAIDNFELNLDANETEEQRYTLNVLPVNEQWNYSIGAKYTHFTSTSATDVVLSRFMLNNTAFKYQNNDESDTKLLDYVSREIENKLRVQNTWRPGPYKITSGFGFEEVKYSTTTLDRRFPNGQELNYESNLTMYKYSLFAQVTRSFLEERLSLSAGLRTDGIDFSENTANLLNQLSPRLSASYNITDALAFNANWGIFYQLPPYTTLGYRDAAGNLANKDVTYIQSMHTVAGLSYLFEFNGKLTAEGFLKNYSNYPFLTATGVSLANLGGDFGVVGNQPATSTNSGRAYGLELSYQQKLYKGFFGIASLTFVKSEFEDANGVLVPSSWDNQLLSTVTLGKKFKGNWEVGLNYQYLGGAPFTPYDVEATRTISNWDNIGRGIPDYDLLNTQRVNSFNRLNVRVDKKWYFNSINLDVYLDIQNILGATVQGQPNIDVQRNADGIPIIDPNDNTKYLVKELENSTGSVLPTFGLIFEF